MGFIPRMQGWHNIHKSIKAIRYINKRTHKNHTIISIHAEKAFDKVQHTLMIKTLSKVGIEGVYLNIIKDIQETYSQHHIQWAKTKSFPTEIRNNTRMSTLSLLFNIVVGVLATVIKQEKEIKGIQIGKEESKLSLFADDIIVYIENPIDSTKKLLDLINEFGKTAGYKVNAKKSKAFLYTNNETAETEIREKNHI